MSDNDKVEYSQYVLQEDDEGLMDDISPNSYEPKVAKKLAPLIYVVVCVLFCLGLLTCSLAFIFLIIDHFSTVLVAMILFPIGFLLIVSSVFVYGCLAFPHKIKKIYKWRP
eukprot:TRINITY_DN3337_c1_g1_i1.p1 TRINITY_DN3337_c1_g1~~TRINITY_DN3337_c1_g1_i1.p1  ORF type:complete len:111 (-),score=27.14 TRINITY_DN3337_c1_g1_i1:218-550(-)